MPIKKGAASPRVASFTWQKCSLGTAREFWQARLEGDEGAGVECLIRPLSVSELLDIVAASASGRTSYDCRALVVARNSFGAVVRQDERLFDTFERAATWAEERAQLAKAAL